MATGGKDGVLRIYKTLEPGELDPNSRDTINPVPFREYRNGHNSDIFDINWSTKNSNLLLTASSNFTVLIYNIGLDKPLQIL